MKPEFTAHELSQIRNGIKTQHRVPVEPRPVKHESGVGCPFYRWRGLRFYEDSTILLKESSPCKPGDRIECDGGYVVVGDVRVQRLYDMEKFDCVREGADCEVDHASPAFVNNWDARHPDHPYDSNSFVFVLDGLRWESSE